jgi:hypothetical protein
VQVAKVIFKSLSLKGIFFFFRKNGFAGKRLAAKGVQGFQKFFLGLLGYGRVAKQNK